VLTNVWRRFDEKGIEIPYPQSQMVFDDTSGELQVPMREADEEVASGPSGATRRTDRRAPADEGAGADEPEDVEPEDEGPEDEGPEDDPPEDDPDGDAGATGSRR
jgi:hypothetical protein